jgi:predicted RNA-binding protein with PIN domain
MVLAAAMANVCGNLAELPKINHENSRPDKGVVAPFGPEFPFSLYAAKGYDARMALVRILVDGYSLLHNWPELAPGQPRYSARAREELIHVLTRYQDVAGTPVTIFFDGSGASAGTPPRESNPAVEVLFSCAGQTADDMIERAAHRFRAYGEVLAVTDDVAERDTVTGMGGLASSCANFIRMVENALTELQDELQNYNRAERNRFNRSHKRDLK